MSIKTNTIIATSILVAVFGISTYLLIDAARVWTEGRYMLLPCIAITGIIAFTSWVMLMLACFTNMCTPEPETPTTKPSQPIYDWAKDGE